MEDLTCTKCGGVLDANYVCPYCGTRFKPNTPQQQVNNINIIINNNVVTPEKPEEPAVPAEPEDVHPEPEDVPTEPGDEPAVPDDAPTESASAEKKGAFSEAATKFANKSFVLYICALIGIPVLLYNWRTSGNDWFAVGALGAGVLVYFISHFFKER